MYKRQIYRDLPISRSTDFPASGSFPVETLNTELDKIVAMMQQNERDLLYSPRADASTANTYNLTFPNLVAGKILSVNSAGNALEFDQSITDVATVAGIAANVTTVSGIAANVTTVAGIAANVTAVAGDATDIGAVAGKATEIGRLGTADAVSDMNLLGTSSNVTSMNTLGTSSNVTAMSNCSGSISSINTVSGSIGDVNRYANEYTIASSAPSSPSEGDLWYDSTNNALKYYTGSTWASISAGISDVVSDTTPQLGGALDCQNNHINNSGTISGANLQIDFGSI